MEVLLYIPTRFKTKIEHKAFEDCLTEIFSLTKKLEEAPNLFIENEELGKDSDFGESYRKKKSELYETQIDNIINIIAIALAMIYVTRYSAPRGNYSAKLEIMNSLESLIDSYFCGREFLQQYTKALFTLTRHEYKPKIEIDVDGKVTITHSKDENQFTSKFCLNNFYKQEFAGEFLSYENGIWEEH